MLRPAERNIKKSKRIEIKIRNKKIIIIMLKKRTKKEHDKREI